MPQRNFAAGVVNGTLYNLVNAFLDPAVVMVVFAAQLTDSNFLLGLVGVVRAASWLLPQLWMSGYIQSVRRVMWIYRYTALFRASMLLVLLVAVLTVKHAGLLLLVFMFCITSEQLAAGVAGLPFLEIVAKVIPAARRGVFFSWRMTLGALLAVGGGLLVRVLLDSQSAWAFPVNFVIIFGSANAFAIMAMLAWIGFVDEPDGEPEGLRKGMGTQLRRAFQALRIDANYRAYIQARVSFLLVIGVVTPFVTVYAKTGFAVPAETLATYLAITAIFGLIGTTLAGWTSARWGNRVLVQLGAGLGMLALLMVVLAAPLGLGTEIAGVYFGVVFALMALRNGTLNIALLALNLNVAPVDKRPLYVGFSNTMGGLFMLLGSAAGALVDVVGFEIFFVLTLLPMFYGVYQVRRLEDPTA